ncbi:MAG: SET domain-containing protein-lysine N-methyltransferase [Gemmataceae bacterium]|nr:SET domain-containing protein-lysine N-methyltransferase [Gemmataceae bacterium]
MTPLADEPDGRFAVGPSTVPGAGRGLFARVDLPAGAVLAVVGVLVRRDSPADVCTHFADRHKLRVGDDLLLIPTGFGGLVNHSTTPNLERLADGDRVFFRTLRPVVAGEELFFRYPDAALERFGMT